MFVYVINAREFDRSQSMGEIPRIADKKPRTMYEMCLQLHTMVMEAGFELTADPRNYKCALCSERAQ